MNPTDSFENTHGETVALPRLRIIARIYTDFPTKFGIPRQSGLCDLPAVIEFEKPFRNPDALRGITDYSHLWLLWLFSEAIREGDGDSFTPTVRPPRLGGNTRMGVFATRSPFRPNPIGLSSVKLLGTDTDESGNLRLLVSGADLMNGTPILDIKPYLPFTDAHPDAVGGFADARFSYRLKVDFPESLLQILPEDRRDAVLEILAEDPRPSYQKDPERVYGFPFAGHEICFSVRDDVLTVLHVE
ncbi:MAG: tRNA (N6-threonylcarbamoyladenosine(37)-N6)-methyltransferase TrmO [Clostridia bacterium]|nr:tRNA (N6-threonylcarbamoyladenosine(37)-N6)-methyltransferase TrmO [Clostridia bacterium]